LIPKPVTEDVLNQTITFFNAESTEDQTKETSVLKLTLNVQVYHGDHIMLDPVVNSESPEKVGLKEKPKMADGDH